MAIERLEFPISKAEYLLRNTARGEGGDKQKFWRKILGFERSDAIREAILSQVTPDLLQATRSNPYGQCYQAIIAIKGPSGKTRQIKTIWIVLFEEDIARFVTAVPYRRKE